MLPGNHTFALVGVLALPGEARQDRCLGLFGLQEQRLDVVAGVHQQDPGAGPDAADAHDLAGDVDEAELLEQVPAVGLQGPPVLAEQRLQLGIDLAGFLLGEHLFDRDDQRWCADEASSPVHDRGELGKSLEAVLGVGLDEHRLGGLVAVGLHLRLERDKSVLDIEVGVPDGHHGLLRELAHGRPVAGDRREDDLAGVLRAVRVVAARDREAGGEPLDVPLERAGQSLVEVVDVEDEPALRRGERPEVGQVRVSAELNAKPGCGSRRQVCGHRQCSPAVEGERRDEHAAVPHGHQLGHAGDALLEKERDRVASGRRGEVRMGLERHVCAGGLAGGDALVPAAMRQDEVGCLVPLDDSAHGASFSHVPRPIGSS